MEKLTKLNPKNKKEKKKCKKHFLNWNKAPRVLFAL